MFRKLLMAGAAAASVLAGSYAATASTGLLRLQLADMPSGNGDSIDPFYGKINPFYGKINPFYGKINPFYGKINPFWGDISPFWGDVDPFYGKINPFYDDMDAFWGSLSPYANSPSWSTVMPFWRDAGPMFGNLNSDWQSLQDGNATDYSGVQAELNTFLNKSAAFWGGAVQQSTGKDFWSGFGNAMLAKYGIDPTNPGSLADVSVEARSAFMLNWYDGLMSFTGVDHVDWWMPAINWSPALSQLSGGGQGVVVGILDATVNGSNADVTQLNFTGGYQYYVNDHGAAVASLVAAQHDGQSIMGIAPNAEIHLYNPFDTSGTASWSDVATGIARLYDSGAHVVNASLGVPGTTVSNEWVNILSGPLLSKRGHDLVIVKAAGNEGMAQTANVPWLLGLEPPNNLIIVGSTGPTGQISSFSNTPGNACFTLLGLCAEQNKLMYHFIVAPGELILVSDNHGGVIRMTGTSFAAPLVTGAVALLQSRWPWLEQHAEETAQILFQSADDLGAPGVDPVYGWGMLDVEAAMSPLDFNKLAVYKPYTYSGSSVNTGLLGTGLLSNLTGNWSAKSLKSSVLTSGQLALWQKQKAFIVAFEAIGGTYRDFTIPLSTLLAGRSQTVNGATNPFQSYLYQRLIDWAGGSKAVGFASQGMQLGDGSWSLGMTTTESTPEELSRGEGPVHSEFLAASRDAGVALRVGEGSASHAFFGDGGFTLRTDFDPTTGGVNPVLGFASGGGYARGSIAVSDSLNLNLGISQKTDNHLWIDPMLGPLQTLPLAANHAYASVTGVEYTITRGVTLNASYTSLAEADGLLGAQGGGVLDFAGGSRTGAATFGSTATFADGWTVSGSATFAHTTAQPADGFVSLSRDGLLSTAYELVAGKSGVFRTGDTLRFSFAQPLHVESGALQYQSVEVIDRDTGALGVVNQSWNVSGNRELRVETLYELPLMEGRANVEGFGLADVNSPLAGGQGISVSIGARFRMGF
jgi:hypothetical protein